MHEKKCEGNIHTHTDTQKSEKFTSSLIKLVSNIFTDRVKKKKKRGLFPHQNLKNCAYHKVIRSPSWITVELSLEGN